MEALAAALDGTALALWAARDPWAYPVANVLHVLGLVLLLGSVALMDVRVLGAFRALPLEPLLRAMLPLALAGFATMALSGLVLFAADARALAGSDVFRWKLGLVALALANAALFRANWHLGREPTAVQRAMALAGLFAWVSVAVLGRSIAYAG